MAHASGTGRLGEKRLNGEPPNDYPTLAAGTTLASGGTGKSRRAQPPMPAAGLTSTPAAPYKPPGLRLSSASLEALQLRHDRARRRSLEAHLSTIAARPQEAPRLSRADGDDRRPQGARTAQSQGTQASVGLSRHATTGDGDRTSQDTRGVPACQGRRPVRGALACAPGAQARRRGRGAQSRPLRLHRDQGPWRGGSCATGRGGA